VVSKVNSLDQNKKIPIVFSLYYDIVMGGVEELHPFDSKKYGKVFGYISESLGIDEKQTFSPESATEDDLLMVHSKDYLVSLRNSENIAKIAEFEMLASIPNDILQEKLIKSVKYATGGTILGCKLALKYGWAMNLSGGYHHAKANEGGGFCFFADIPIGVFRTFEKNPDLSVLIVDLDAHQGNGYASIFKDDPRVSIFDVYNQDIYPHDEAAKRYIRFHYPVSSGIGDDEYTTLIASSIPEALKSAKPGLIIYIAGADIFEDDTLGGMCISANGIQKRDEIVFSNAVAYGIPVLMVSGGGYAKETATITGTSIVHILKNVVGSL